MFYYCLIQRLHETNKHIRVKALLYITCITYIIILSLLLYQIYIAPFSCETRSKALYNFVAAKGAHVHPLRVQIQRDLTIGID